MNYYKCFRSFLSAIFAIFSFLSATILVAADTTESIPEPFLPIAELGPYKPIIENMQNLLQQRQHSEFYSVALKFLKELKENEWEEKRFEAKTREAGMAKEWTYYLISGAPVMEMDEFFVSEKLPKKDDLYVDIYARSKVIGIIQNAPFGVRRESAKRIYKRKNGIDYKEIFTPEEIRKIEIAHVAYYAAILKKSRDAYRQASVEKRLENYLQTPGYSTTPLTLPSNNVMSDKGIQEILDNAMKNEATNNPNIGYEISRLKGYRLSTLTSYGMPWGDAKKKGFAKFVVDSFPNDAVSVREYLKKAGYVSDIALADALQSAYPRMKRTEWLFAGLPDEKTTEAFLGTNAFIKDPLVEKELEAINNAVKEALVLNKRAKKRFNLLVAKFRQEAVPVPHIELYKKAAEELEKELQVAALADSPQTWTALHKAECALFSKLELQLVLQLQATKDAALLPPMQKYLKLIREEKEKIKTELATKESKDLALLPK
ncbi:MAG: hypothetical protein LBV54_00505 [Puniceicoccales bacterium]|jgi:hypothetical protein|nr:hypothetical protein [Puniceicoccales bacterium]